MNVKQAIEMLYKPNDMPIKITIGYGEDFKTDIDIYNSFHMEAYGKFKIDSIRALDTDEYWLNIATTQIKPIIE